MLRGFNSYHRTVMFSVASIETLRVFGIFLVMPVFTPYGGIFTNSGVLVGIAFGAYGIAMALFQIPFGIFSDRVGRRKALMIGMVPFIIGNLLCWEPGSIGVLIAGRFIAGSGAVTSVSIALLQESVPGDRRNVAMAVVGIPVGLSFLVGIIVGPMISSILGTNYIFLISAILGVISYIPLWRLKEIPAAERRISARGKIQKNSIKLGIISFFVSSLMFSYFFYLSLYQQQFLQNTSLTLLLLWPVIIGGVIGLVSSGIADRGHSVSTTLMCLIILLLSIPMIFSISFLRVSYFTILFASILFFVGYSLYEIVFPPLVARMSREGSYGANLGVYNVLQFSGQLGGSVVAGVFLGQVIGGHGPFIVTGILLAGLAVSLLVLYNLTSFKEVTHA